MVIVCLKSSCLGGLKQTPMFFEWVFRILTCHHSERQRSVGKLRRFQMSDEQNGWNNFTSGFVLRVESGASLKCFNFPVNFSFGTWGRWLPLENPLWQHTQLISCSSCLRKQVLKRFISELVPIEVSVTAIINAFWSPTIGSMRLLYLVGPAVCCCEIGFTAWTEFAIRQEHFFGKGNY